MLTDQFIHIEEKITRLVTKVIYLQKQNEILSEKNRTLRAELETKAFRVLEPEVKGGIHDASARKKAPDKEDRDSHRLKKEIEEYVQEIDKCIERLKNY